MTCRSCGFDGELREIMFAGVAVGKACVDAVACQNRRFTSRAEELTEQVRGWSAAECVHVLKAITSRMLTITVTPPPDPRGVPTSDQAKSLRQGQVMHVIRELHEKHGLTIMEAKAYVDMWRREPVKYGLVTNEREPGDMFTET